MSNMIADRYMIVTSLGEGGMADVFLAMDTILNREVAVKVLRGELSEDPVTLLRFLREASAVSKLHHPNVVEVYDVGEYEGKNYIVMEYIRGRTLKQMILQRGALPKDEAVDVMKQLVSAVNHAHENNIIHRDIKPQNVLVKDDGTVKITDFGIALAHDAIQLTQSDAVLGSAHYIAPETTKGEVASVQTDIYALGVVFYELLTGTVPFKGENPIQIAMKHLRDEIPSVREINPTIPQSIDNIVIKATAKNRMKRYANAKDLLFDLDMCLLPEFSDVEKVRLDGEEVAAGTMVLNNVNDLDVGDGTVEIEDKEIRKIKNNTKSKKATKSKHQNADKKKKMIIIGVSVVVALVALLGVLYATGVFGSNEPEEEEVIIKVKVPNLEGLSQEDAEKALKSKGLKLGKVSEEVTDNIDKGIVIEQSVAYDKKIEKGSKVNITVSSGKYFVVNDYIGWNIDDAKAELEAAGIIVEVEQQETDDTAPNNIISQSMLSKGTKVKPGDSKKIKFIVAKEKKKEMVTLEDYTGLNWNFKSLKKELEKLGIIPSVEVSSDKACGEPGLIMTQLPVSGNTYETLKGLTVKFEVCGGSETDNPSSGDEEK